MTALKRLEGVQQVFQEAYTPGVGIFSATYAKPPLLRTSTLAQALGTYKLDRLLLRVTAEVEEKDGAFQAAGYRLVKGELALQPGRHFLVGVVGEDAQGVPTLALTKAEPKK